MFLITLNLQGNVKWMSIKCGLDSGVITVICLHLYTVSAAIAHSSSVSQGNWTSFLSSSPDELNSSTMTWINENFHRHMPLPS